MGAALFVVLDREVEGLETFVDGKALSASEAALSKACAKLGVPDLWSFFSSNPDEMAEFLEGEDLETEDLPALETEKWFSPEEGLQTVRALIQAIRAGEITAGESSGVEQDLREIERILLGASQGGARWHFAVDF